MSEEPQGTLESTLEQTFSTIDAVVESWEFRPRLQEFGTVLAVGRGVVRATGLPGVRSQEVVRFQGGQLGMAFNLDPGEVGVILLDKSSGIRAGAELRRTERVLDIPVGEALLGRVVDAVGRPRDGKGPLQASGRRPIERPAPPVMHRAPVTTPLETGLKVVDALIPIGRGQRELILGDRQTGKTAIAVDTIINQKGKDVLCIYCAIGQRSSAVATAVASLRSHGALDYCTVVFAGGEEPPALQFVAPYAAMSMAEYFMSQGRDTLVVFDDLTHHARAYRELSLLLRRPPGREGFPGDIFYLHSRLLERSTHLRDEHGGGSLTALPVIETEEQNISAYIPTNLISITDGQIYLSPDLFQKGVLPAVDVGKSVSRVGGKTQLPAYRAVAGDLRLAYSQFVELEAFSRFGTRLDEDTRKTLDRGRRVREVLKQPQYEPMPVAEQISVLIAVNGGVFDEMALDGIAGASRKIRETVKAELPELCGAMEGGERLGDDDIGKILKTASRSLGRE